MLTPIALSAQGEVLTIIVNTTDDNDDGTCNNSHCSLREAINAAKENGINALTALGEAKGMKKEHITKLANADFGVAMEIVAEKEAPSSTPAGGENPNAEGKEGVNTDNPKTEASQANIVDAIANAMKGGEGSSTKKLEDYSPAELEALHNSDPVAFDKLHGIS